MRPNLAARTLRRSRQQGRDETRWRKNRSTDEGYPALKEIFNRARLHHIAKQMSAVQPRFDSRKFLQLATRDLDSLSIMQRLRQTAVSLGAVLPERFPDAVAELKKLAPRIGDRFVAMVLSEYVAVFGLEHFDASMRALEALHHVRLGRVRDPPFPEARLRSHDRRDGGVGATQRTSTCAGSRAKASRPRLPWSFKLDAAIADPRRPGRFSTR